MASPIGSANQVFAIGYDNEPTQPIVSAYPPAVPWALTAGTYATGTTGTSSAESGASSTYAIQTTAQLYVNPFYLDQDVVYREIEHDISADTVAGTGSATGGWFGGLYSFGTSYSTTGLPSEVASGTYFTKVTDWVFNYRISQNSVTAQTYSLASGEAPSAWSSTQGNLSTDFTGQQRIHVFSTTVAQTLSQGKYLIVHGHTRRTAGAAVFSGNHGAFLLQSNFAGAAHYLGSAAFDSPVQSAGSMTTVVVSTHSTGTAGVSIGGAPLPDSFVRSQISATASGDIRMLMPNFYY